jgi:hypothetical protein
VPSDAPRGCLWRGQGRSTALPGRLAHAQASPQPRRWYGKSPCAVAQRVSFGTYGQRHYREQPTETCRWTWDSLPVMATIMKLLYTIKVITIYDILCLP